VWNKTQAESRARQRTACQAAVSDMTTQPPFTTPSPVAPAVPTADQGNSEVTLLFKFKSFKIFR
jgi:hypothetical protein